MKIKPLALEVGAFDLTAQVLGSVPQDVVLVTDDGIENLTAYLSHELCVAR